MNGTDPGYYTQEHMLERQTESIRTAQCLFFWSEFFDGLSRMFGTHKRSCWIWQNDTPQSLSFWRCLIRKYKPTPGAM